MIPAHPPSSCFKRASAANYFSVWPLFSPSSQVTCHAYVSSPCLPHTCPLIRLVCDPGLIIRHDPSAVGSYIADYICKRCVILAFVSFMSRLIWPTQDQRLCSHPRKAIRSRLTHRFITHPNLQIPNQARERQKAFVCRCALLISYKHEIIRPPGSRMSLLSTWMSM
jgi:hypothetical protein